MQNLIRTSVQALSGYVPGEQPSDLRVVKLNTNENPYPPSPRVADVLAQMDGNLLRLYPNPVSAELRDAVARLHGCDASQVFVGNGSDEVLALCTRAFVENDGVVGYFELSYSLYPVLCDIRDVRKRAEALEPDFAWRTPRTTGAALFFLTNPNAPTGILYPKDRVREFCEAFEGVVVIDEAYVDFAREDCIELALRLDNVLVARTFSKSYAMAGVRVGYAVGAPALIEALQKIKDSYNVNRLSQQLALAAVNDREHMLGSAEKIKATRARLSTVLSEWGYGVCPSETNFLWVRPPQGNAAEIFEALRKQRILVRYFPGDVTGQYLRITIGTDNEINQLITTLRDLGAEAQS